MAARSCKINPDYTVEALPALRVFAPVQSLAQAGLMPAGAGRLHAGPDCADQELPPAVSAVQIRQLVTIAAIPTQQSRGEPSREIPLNRCQNYKPSGINRRI